LGCDIRVQRRRRTV